MYLISQNKKKLTAQPIRFEFKILANLTVTDYNAFALVLTPRLVLVSSDGQILFYYKFSI